MAKEKKTERETVDELLDYGEMFGQMYQDIGAGIRQAEEERRRARGFG